MTRVCYKPVQGGEKGRGLGGGGGGERESKREREREALGLCVIFCFSFFFPSCTFVSSFSFFCICFLVKN